MKTQILNLRRSGENQTWWQLNFGKRPAEELYQITRDEDCVQNLIESPSLTLTKNRLRDLMTLDLMRHGDPRMFGYGEIFDTYPYFDKRTAHFFERYMSGEKVKAGWVNPSDFEKARLER